MVLGAVRRLFQKPKREGVLMLDVLIGIAVFSVFVSFIVFSMLFSQRSLLLGGDRMRAVYLAQQGIEAARAIRDQDFASLTTGTHGVRLNPQGKWALSGTGVTSSDGFVTRVTITPAGTDAVDVIARTIWNMGLSRSGSVILQTTVTDWRTVHTIGNWASVSVQGSYTDSGTPLFNSSAVSGNYAFVSSEISSGGAGLYVFDITNPATPIRVAAGFTLGTAGYKLITWNNKLIVITGDASAEVRIYDIADPVNLSSANLVASINIPGSSRARAAAIFSDYLYVTATEDITEHEFYGYDLAELTDIQLTDSLDDTATYTDIHLHEGYAYLSSTSDTMEMRVVDVFNAEDLTFAPGNGYNLTDVTDGKAIVTYENSVIVGRADGEVTEELVLFDISGSPVPSPPPGPWYSGAGGSVTSLDVDPSGVYGFVADDADLAEFRVLNLTTYRTGGNPLLASYNTTTGAGRSVYYVPSMDRVIFLTNKGFIILRPA